MGLKTGTSSYKEFRRGARRTEDMTYRDDLGIDELLLHNLDGDRISSCSRKTKTRSALVRTERRFDEHKARMLGNEEVANARKRALVKECMFLDLYQVRFDG
jgi:hypothetical protein